MSRFVLGIDAGGTKTLAVIADERGRLLVAGRAGAGNPDGVGRDAAHANLCAAITSACADAQVPDTALDAAFFGLAGVVSDLDRAAAEAAVGRLGLRPDTLIGIDHDCRVALTGGLSGRPGIVLIAGTGSSCFGLNASGERWLAGGWGSLFVDEGSGYWLAVEALRLAACAADGRGPGTELLPALVSALGAARAEDLPRRLAADRPSRPELAALAPLVFQATADGDAVAHRLLERGAGELARSVTAVARRLDMTRDRLEVVTVGGLFSAGDQLLRPLEGELALRLPSARLVTPELPPAAGAALLALGLLGVPTGEAMLRDLAAASADRLTGR